MFNSKRIAALEKRVRELEALFLDLATYRTRRGEMIPLHDMIRENFDRMNKFTLDAGYRFQPEVNEVRPAKWVKIKGTK